jgi:flavin reductase (DIM6/NTAB) family NADH-FMN oxidoreductase RutF
MKVATGPTDRFYPMPCPLVVGGSIERADALAVAWIGIAGNTPPSIAMALRRTRHTLALIREHGDFTVNVPPVALAAKVDYCGITSGATTDKFANTGLTLSPATFVTAPLIDECPYNLECRVTHEIELGEYVLVVGEVVESHAEESILRDGKVDVGLLDPLVYVAGSREYRGLSDKIADAFSIGKSIREDL